MADATVPDGKVSKLTLASLVVMVFLSQSPAEVEIPGCPVLRSRR